LTALSNIHYIDIKENPMPSKKEGLTCTEIMVKAKCSINTARKFVHLRGITLGRGPMNETVIPMAKAELVIADIRAALERRRAHPKDSRKKK